MLETIFQVIGGYNQVEHCVESLKMCLNEWQSNGRFKNLECLSLENISCDSMGVIDKRMGKNVVYLIVIAMALNRLDRSDWRIKLIFVASTTTTLTASLFGVEHVDCMLTWPSSNSKK